METIDPTIKNLVSAIGRAETGKSSPEAYTQKGASGEFGRYQFMPETYKAYAKRYLGNENAEPSIENQNKIAYAFVKEKKDKGFNPAQIASMWNAGEGRPNAYKEGFKGINDKGVAYDVPAYVKRVSDYYRELSQTNQSQEQTPYGYVQAPEVPEAPTADTVGVGTQREELMAQGQPVSVNPEKAQPTFAGSIVRGILKPFAQVGTSLVNMEQLVRGKELTHPFSGGYLGNVERVGEGFDVSKGFTKENVSALKKSAGTGINIATTIGGGSGAKATVKTAQTGLKFSEPIAKQAVKGFAQGSKLGFLSGVGYGLSEDKNLADTATSGLAGALGGGILGSITGTVGGLISKAKGITPETETIVKNKLEKEYVDSLSKTAAGRKVLAETEKGRVEALKAGIYPNIKDGVFDSEEAIAKLQDEMDKLGKARGTDIASQNRPADIGTLLSKIQQNVNEYVKDDLENKKVQKVVTEWIEALNKNVDLVKLNEKQIAADKLAKFEGSSDATVRKAYKSIYHGIGNYLNDTVQDTNGMNKIINDNLSRYHSVRDFLEGINGKKVATKDLINILGSHAAKTIGTGVGGVKGIIFNEALPIAQKALKKIFGGDMSSYSKVMDAIKKGDTAKIDEILQKVTENKGAAFAQRVRRALEELPQLPAPVQGATKKGINVPINLPAKSASTLEKAEMQNIKRGLLNGGPR